MTEMPVPTRTAMNVLEQHKNITVTSQPNEQIAFVLFNDDFKTLSHVSYVLDRFGLKVEKKMWVDKGQKVYLKSGQTVTIG